jgi:hypoxanthine phosphoribosyltransferase
MPGTDLAVSEQRKEALSWGQVDWMIELAVKTMRERHCIPSRIIPIGGGGLIPASIMAYRLYKKEHLPINLMPPVYAKSYSPDHKQGALSIVWPDDIQSYDASTTLFVDDIVDTGRTLWAINERMPKSSYFALVSKVKELRFTRGHASLLYSQLDNENRWWIFPWEKERPD